jgi:membrane protease YdiL (CAAX protease family)
MISSNIIPNSLVKVITFLLIWGIIWLPLGIIITNIIKGVKQKTITTEQKLPLVASLYLLAPLMVKGANQILGYSWRDYGLNWQLGFFLSLLLGLGLSLASLATTFLVQGWLNYLEWYPENLKKFKEVIFPLLGVGLGIGLIEELIFRGLIFTELQQEYTIIIAAIISSAIFALLHLIWEQKKTMPQLPGLWLMGMVLVEARLIAQGSLGLAIGLHAGWIWGLSSLDSSGLFAYTPNASRWIIGIDKQPLAGLAGIICLLATALVLLLLKVWL